MERGVAQYVAALLLITAAAIAQELPGGGGGPPSAASNLYLRLRSVGLDPSRVYRIREAHINREDLHILLNSGVIAFTEAVDGRTTGAFFAGDGEVLLAPPDRVERWSLSLFTGAAILEERITSAYLRFNDNTFAELEPNLRPFVAAPALPEPDVEPDPEEPAEPAERAPATPEEFVARWGPSAKSLAQLSALRVLMTFVNAHSTASDGTPHWKRPAKDRMLHARVIGSRLGVFDVYFDTLAAEQIAVAQRADKDGTSYYDTWTAFPMRSERLRVAGTRSGAPPAATAQTQTAAEAFSDPVKPLRYTIRAQIRPPRELQAETTVELYTTEPGQRILVFELSRFLQVQEITLDGKALEFVQNDALEGSELARRGNDVVAVVFPAPLAPNRPVCLRFTYRGDVLSDAGGGLMYVGARGIWYPNRGIALADFDMEFRYPAPWMLVATGKQVPASTMQAVAEAGGEQVARFVSERPIALAGFNLGQYVKAEVKAGPVAVETYAARSVEDKFPRQHTVIAEENIDPWTGRRLRTMQMLPAPLPQPAQQVREVAARAAGTVGFLAARFGPFPYRSLALAQMPGTSSQGWPGMVYLSSYAFLSPEERRRGRLTPYADALYGHLMLGHEIAHQWWGDLLLWKSYREQWLVEALSNYSMLLMIEQEDPAVFRTLMEQYRHELLAKNKDGRPMADAGPVTLGVRLNSSRFPDAYDTVAYGRGTWLFHMLRHMLVDDAGRARRGRAGQAGADDPFIAVLRGLRERFEGKSITTRDVQQAFEDALPDSLRYEGRKSLEWFFDGWVNGTAVPSLDLAGVKLAARAGRVTASGRIQQKHAPKDLVTSVPIYAETGSGKPVLLGRVLAEGTETPFRFTAPSGTRKLLLDPYATVLTRP